MRKEKKVVDNTLVLTWRTDWITGATDGTSWGYSWPMMFAATCLFFFCLSVVESESISAVTCWVAASEAEQTDKKRPNLFGSCSGFDYWKKNIFHYSSLLQIPCNNDRHCRSLLLTALTICNDTEEC